MSDVKAEWSKVGEQFRDLGTRLREHYRESGGAASEEKAAESAAPEAEEKSEEREPVMSDEKAKEAVDQLAAAVDRIADAVREAARDPEIKAEAGAAANSLVDALAMSFEELGGEFKGLVEKLRQKKSGGAAPEGEAESDSEAPPEE